jgi:hypothetical protein
VVLTEQKQCNKNIQKSKNEKFCKFMPWYNTIFQTTTASTQAIEARSESQFPQLQIL